MYHGVLEQFKAYNVALILHQNYRNLDSSFMSNKIPTNNSDDFCKKIKPGSKTTYYSLGGGLRLRVSPNGSKHWVLVCNVKIATQVTSKPGDNYISRSFSLGPFYHGNGSSDSALTVKQAKNEAAEIKLAIKKGFDPSIEKKRNVEKRIAEEAARRSVREVYDEWMQNEICQRKDGGKEVSRMMEKDVLPVIGKLSITDVQKAHIVRINNDVKKRGQRIAKVVYDLCRQLIEYSIHNDYLKPHDSPIIGIDQKRIGSDGKSRDRVLSESEIRELFSKLPSSGLMGVNLLAIPIQLSTSVRIGELLTAKWSHVNFENRVWRIPDTKNGTSHTIYLSHFAVSNLYQLYELTQHSDWLFPSSKTDSHIDPKAITKQIADRQRIDETEIIRGRSLKNSQSLLLSGGAWRPHDLRRTAATLMGELGIIPIVIEKTLNHSEGSKLQKTYQRYDYKREMIAAWEQLGQKLHELSSQ